MDKLILDPGLFEIPAELPLDCQLTQFLLLKDNLEFFAAHTSLAIDEYNGAPYSEYSDYPSPNIRPPVVKCNSIIHAKYTAIQKQIYKLIAKGEYVCPEHNTLEICPLTFYDGTVSERPFLEYLYWLLITNAEAKNRQVILLSARNYKFQPDLICTHNGKKFLVRSLSSAPTDCNGIIGQYLLDEEPSDVIFPCKAACEALDDAFEQERSTQHLNDNEKISLCKLYGTEVAYRNKYIHDANISRKNPDYTVFKHPDTTFFISIDIEHGGLELFKKRGHSAIHIGEYNFSCILQQPPDPSTHKINI